MKALFALRLVVTFRTLHNDVIDTKKCYVHDYCNTVQGKVVTLRYFP